MVDSLDLTKDWSCECILTRNFQNIEKKLPMNIISKNGMIDELETAFHAGFNDALKLVASHLKKADLDYMAEWIEGVHE